MEKPRRSRSDYLADLGLRAVIGLCLALPYRRRVPLMGWIVARIVSPLARWPRRIRENLAYVMPEMPEAEVRRLVRKVPDNFGRSMIEIYSGDPVPRSRARHCRLAEAASRRWQRRATTGQPVMLVTGHFGNYDAPRAALVAQRLSGRRPVSSGAQRLFQRPLFRRHRRAWRADVLTDRRDLPKMIRFIREGGMQGIVIDLNAFGGEHLDFLGKPALTAISAAEIALKYGALLVPIYGIRQPGGLDFDIRVEAPIPHSDPVTMTQALNDSLAALVRQYPDQWFWIHRRWKLPRDGVRRLNTQFAGRPHRCT